MSSKAERMSTRFPFCLVWTPLPLVSYLLPFVGHMGVATSTGVVYDFAGHCTVNVDNLAFGAPTKWIQLQPEKAVVLLDQVNQSIRNGSSKTTLATTWDDWLNFSRSIYGNRLYGFFTDNCHGFVAHFLNSIRYEQAKDWNAISLAWAMFLSRSYVGGAAGLAKTWGPFCVLMAAGWHFGGSAFLLAWLALAVIAVAWFCFYACCVAKPAANRILSV